MTADAHAAMVFARRVHAGQARKYTGNPYADHLAEVAGIVATVAPPDMAATMIAVAWLHDCVEDQGVTPDELHRLFGLDVAHGVEQLSDLETGNRADRKAASRRRLSAAEGWIQTIKCADLISNTASIVLHDPKFAEIYLAEKRSLLSGLTLADPRLREMALQQAKGPAMTQPAPFALATLRSAIADYDRAELGRLNAPADALRSAATACGWTWGLKEPLRQWAANRLTGEDRPDIVK